MKKALHYFLSASVAFLFFSNNSFGQAASAVWSLATDQTSAVTGAVTASAQSLSGLEIKNYQTMAAPTSGYNNGVAVPAQRILPTVAGGWAGGESAMVTGRYAEYAVSPLIGSDLTVTSVALAFGDSGSTNTMKADIYYSTDNFVTQTKLNVETTGFILPKFSAAELWVQASYTGLSISVPSTKTFKLRVYPWYPSTASTSKYVVESNITINGTTAVASLPLDFLSFTAKPDALGKTVNLNWATTNEVNTANFEIQKKTGTADFVTIGTRDSKNTAGNHNYSFVDENATSGTAYYRVLQFDKDNSSKSSEIVAVTNRSTALSIYPNPVGDVLNVNHASANQSASYKVLSLDGKVMFQQGATANTSSASINVSQLTPGAYMLVFDNNGSSSVKFIKK